MSQPFTTSQGLGWRGVTKGGAVTTTMPASKPAVQWFPQHRERQRVAREPRASSGRTGVGIHDSCWQLPDAQGAD
jgi:hypothetical protein